LLLLLLLRPDLDGIAVPPLHSCLCDGGPLSSGCQPSDLVRYASQAAYRKRTLQIVPILIALAMPNQLQLFSAPPSKMQAGATKALLRAKAERRKARKKVAQSVPESCGSG
jgi:hypothetical protein